MKNGFSLIDDFGFYGKGFDGYVHYNKAVNSTKNRKKGGGGGGNGNGAGCSTLCFLFIFVGIFTVKTIISYI